MKPALIFVSALMYAGSAFAQINVNAFPAVHSLPARQPGPEALDAQALHVRSVQVGLGEGALIQLQIQQTSLAQLPATVLSHMAAGSVVTAQDKNRHTITINDMSPASDPNRDSGRIIDLSTGNVMAVFGPEVGIVGALPPSVSPDPNGNVSVKGYSRNIVRNLVTSLVTSEKIATRGSTSEINFNGKNSFQFRDSVLLKDNSGVFRPHVIVQDRTYVYVYYDIHGDSELVPVFRPYWLGTPADMAAAWSAYTPFFAPASAWWRGGKFLKWEPPYTCSYNPFTSDDCWHQRYSMWGWTWNSDPFYNGYYLPRGIYASAGDFLVDYRIQQELENDHLKRLAAFEDPSYDEVTSALELSMNQTAVNSNNVPISELTRLNLVEQTEDIVGAIQNGTRLYASDLFWCDGTGLNDWAHCAEHIFTADGIYSEKVTAGNNDYNCSLTPGDLIQRDGSKPLVTQQSHNPDGTAQVDGDGNPVLITYVPMTVKASKQLSCQVGLTVMVQATSLQNMLSEEIARTEEGIEKVVHLGIFPH